MHRAIAIECGKRPRLTAGTMLLGAAWISGMMQILAQAPAQTPTQTSTTAQLSQQVQTLSDSIVKLQTQMEESQKQLLEMQQQLDSVRKQLAAASAQPPAGATPAKPAPQPEVASTTPPAPHIDSPKELEALQEKQAMQEAQLATLDQSKVSSDSKYPVVLSGMVLMNAFSNTVKVDSAATPTVALVGPGSTGASIRQTVLGIDARGPSLWGASSSADLRMDFAGSSGATGTSYGSGSYGAAANFRLRTAHAALDWQDTQLFFALDRPILSPNVPASIVQVAEPPLAWSGNLWAWNVQAGVSHNMPLAGGVGLQMKAALIDTGDAPYTAAYASAFSTQSSTAENSRWPGGELHLALADERSREGSSFGVGGYIAPHRVSSNVQFNAWAGTVDARWLLPKRFEFTGSAYRGRALGGLGEGEFKDYVSMVEGGETYTRALDDVGGWAQIKQRTNEHLQFNAALGFDQVFAGQLRPYAAGSTAAYQDLARNRSYMINAIYSPSAYLLFSFEYRRLETAPVSGKVWISNIFSTAFGYRF